MPKIGSGLACNHLLSRIDSFSANLSASADPLGSSKGASAECPASSDTERPLARRTHVCATNRRSGKAENQDDGKTRDIACA
jgi:hypothetical protein